MYVREEARAAYSGVNMFVDPQNRLQGAAVGAGFCLMMGSDLRIAAKDAKLSANFVKLGLHPGVHHRCHPLRTTYPPYLSTCGIA